MSTSDWIATSGIVISIATLLVSIMLQLRVLNRQIRQANFSELTRRYHEIFLPIPVAFHSSARLEDQADRDNLLQRLRAYFNLCSEEHHLFTEGFVDRKVWRIWERNMQLTFQRPIIRQAWAIVRQQCSYDESFLAFVARHIPDSTSPAPTDSGKIRIP